MENKEELLNKLIRLEISSYRRSGLIKTGKYLHEPLGYYMELREIYGQLDAKGLKKLLELKPKPGKLS